MCSKWNKNNAYQILKEILACSTQKKKGRLWKRDAKPRQRLIISTSVVCFAFCCSFLFIFFFMVGVAILSWRLCRHYSSWNSTAATTVGWAKAITRGVPVAFHTYSFQKGLLPCPIHFAFFWLRVLDSFASCWMLFCFWYPFSPTGSSWCWRERMCDWQEELCLCQSYCIQLPLIATTATAEP